MISDALYRSLRSLPEIQKQFRRIARRLPHRKRQVRHLGQRLQVDPSELHGYYLYYEREYDDYIFEFLSSRIDRYSQAIDVGANIGIYSVFFGARLKSVEAFEPEQLLLPRLQANLDLNGLANVNI